MQLSRLASSIALFIVCLAARVETGAQTTSILNLCTEAELRTALETGGSYRVECVSNIVAINLKEPLIFARDISLVATNEVVLSGQNLTRVAIVRPGVRVTLGGFSFFSGRQTETNVNDGGIDETAGGGIYNDGGTVTLLKGRFQGNSVVGITGGAGVDGTGDRGEAGGDAAGAAIFNNGGVLLVSNVVFEANAATGGVGGKGGAGRSFGNGENGGDGGDGGSAAGSAIYSIGGRVVVVASTFTNNTAIGAVAGASGAAGGVLGLPGDPGASGDAVGAAISGNNAEISVYGSFFITNSVRASNGLNGNAGVGRDKGGQGMNGGDAAGGAIYSTGSLTVTNSTFFANIAVSGNGGVGGAASSSGFGNDGGDGGDGGFATGGAIESTGGAVIVNSTFSDNLLTAGTGGAGGVGAGLGEQGDSGSQGSALGGAIYGSVSEVTLANSILANSLTTIDGNVIDRGGNISTDRNPLLTSPASLRLTDPFLQPVANNGGPTATMAIRTNSPGIDRGVIEYCPSIDQRGTNRIGTCDIGAFELVLPLPSIPDEVFAADNFRVFTRSNAVVLRWIAGYTNLYVQVNTNLASTNNVWTTITLPSDLVVSNSYNFLTIPPVSMLPQAYYRLFGQTVRSNSGGVFPFPQLPSLPQ